MQRHIHVQSIALYCWFLHTMQSRTHSQTPTPVAIQQCQLSYRYITAHVYADVTSLLHTHTHACVHSAEQRGRRLVNNAAQCFVVETWNCKRFPIARHSFSLSLSLAHARHTCAHDRAEREWRETFTTCIRVHIMPGRPFSHFLYSVMYLLFSFFFSLPVPFFAHL